MAEIEVRLPKMGESVTEATITNWLKNIGDKVAIDEPLVEVATDKVDNELPSEASGILSKRFFEKDQVAQVGDVIAILSTDEISTTKEVSPETIESVKEIEVIQEQKITSDRLQKLKSYTTSPYSLKLHNLPFFRITLANERDYKISTFTPDSPVYVSYLRKGTQKYS